MPRSSDRAATQPLADREGSAEPLIYLPMDCPVCGRHRIEWDGSTLRCEKCTTSSEWDGFTVERYKARAASPVAESGGEHPYHEACPKCWSRYQALLRRAEKAEAAAAPPAENGLREALYKILTVCGSEGYDPTNAAMAFQMIRDFADAALAATRPAEPLDVSEARRLLSKMERDPSDVTLAEVKTFLARLSEATPASVPAGQAEPDEWAVDTRTWDENDGPWTRHPMTDEATCDKWIAEWRRGGVIRQVRKVRIFVGLIQQLAASPESEARHD